MAYADQANRGQDFASNKLACEPKPPTAAEELFAAAKRMHDGAAELEKRVDSLSGRFAASAPETKSATPPRPVRGGIIGDLHDVIDATEEIVSRVHRLMSDIERKV